MKSIAVVLGVLLLLSASVFASALPPTIVNGHVYGADGKTPVSGVEVKVWCDNGDTNVGPLSDTTNAKGFYAVEFGLSEDWCPVGSTVTVEAGGNSATGVVKDSKVLTKDIAYVNLSIPEFGVVGASVAMLGAVVAFMVFRKRR